MMRRPGPSHPPAPAASLLLAACLLSACQSDGNDGRQRDAAAADTAPAWAEDGAVAVHLRAVDSPTPPGSAEPNVTAGPEGYYLSWLQRLDAGGHALRYATLPAGAAADLPAGAETAEAGWSDPRTILEREDLFVNWADFPSVLALDNGLMAAHWLQKSGPGTYAYDVRTAISTDQGRTWGEDVIPHRDGTQTEHGFVAMFPDGDAVGAIWLDGRETVDGEPMTLRHTTLGPDGAEPETLLDASVCDCCQTDAAVADAGPVVVYRDRTANEIRDIYVVRRVAGRWTDPAPVHQDGWEIAACPVNGPAIGASGEDVVVVWFTGAEPEGARVLATFSEDGGATFGSPVRLDQGGAMGRVDVVMLEDGSALASWIQRGGNGAGILLRRVGPHALGPVTRLGDTSPERASGFPRMARIGDEILFAWTEAGDPGTVRTAIGTLPSGRLATAASRP